MTWIVFGPGDDPAKWTEQHHAPDEQEARELAAELLSQDGKPFHALKLEPPGAGWIVTADGSYDYR